MHIGRCLCVYTYTRVGVERTRRGCRVCRGFFLGCGGTAATAFVARFSEREKEGDRKSSEAESFSRNRNVGERERRLWERKVLCSPRMEMACFCFLVSGWKKKVGRCGGSVCKVSYRQIF